MGAFPLALRERLLLGILTVAGATGATAGLLATGSPDDPRLAYLLGILALLLILTAYVLASRINTLHTLAARSAATETIRYWGYLRNTALTVHILLGLVVVHAALVVASRSGVALPAFTRLEAAATAVLSVLLALAVPVAFYYTLRVPLTPRAGLARRAGYGLLLAGSVLAAGGILAVLLRDRLPQAPAALNPALLLLAGLALHGFALGPGRALPTPYAIVTEPREYYGAARGGARTRSILVPATLAFSILFVAFFLIVFFGVGQAGFAQPIQLGVVLFIVLAMATSIGLSLRLARTQERRRFEREGLAGETRAGIAVFLGSALASVVALGLAGLLHAGVPIAGLDATAWPDAFAIGLMLGLGPYGYYVWSRERRIQRLEERLPDLLRDIAATHTGGLTIAAAIRIASMGDYGPLGPEVRAMADQLTWDVPLNDVLTQFADRVATPLAGRSVGLIIEASRSGGNTSDVLMAAARDARDIKALESQRRSTMGLYTVVVYLTFLVFLGVIALLYATLVPQLLEAGGAVADQPGASSAGLSIELPTSHEYRVYYFLTAVVQALGNGALVGLLQAGRARLGLRHAFNMVLITYLTFLALR